MDLTKISYSDLKSMKDDLVSEIDDLGRLRDGQRGRDYDTYKMYEKKWADHPNHRKIRKIDKELKSRLDEI